MAAKSRGRWTCPACRESVIALASGALRAHQSQVPDFEGEGGRCKLSGYKVNEPRYPQLVGRLGLQIANAIMLREHRDWTPPTDECGHCGHPNSEHRNGECRACGYNFAAKPTARHAYQLKGA